MVILFKHVIITIIIIIIIIFDLRKKIRQQIRPEYGKLSPNQKLLVNIGIKFQWVYETSVTKILILDHDILIR